MIARYRVQYSSKAISELVGIYAYIARDSPEKAEETIEWILGKVAGLELFPHRQKVHDARKRIAGDVRSYPIEKYVVFFEIVELETVVHVLRIRHGSQRPLRRF